MINEDKLGIDESIKVNGKIYPEKSFSSKLLKRCVITFGMGAGIFFGAGLLDCAYPSLKIGSISDKPQRVITNIVDMIGYKDYLCKQNGATKISYLSCLRNYTETLPSSIYTTDNIPEMKLVDIKDIRNWKGGGRFVSLQGGINVVFQTPRLENYVDSISNDISRETQPLKDYVDKSIVLYEELLVFLSSANPKDFRLAIPCSWDSIPEGQEESLKYPGVYSYSSIPIGHFFGYFFDKKNVHWLPAGRFDYFSIKRRENK